MSKIINKLLIITMLVMLICCVSAVSAVDTDEFVGTEDADIIEVDEAVDSVDAVEQDDSSDVADELEQEDVGDITDEVKQEDIANVTDELENTRGAQQYVTNGTVGTYFDTSTGYIKSGAPTGLIFQGSFDHMPFSNFIINRGVSLSFSGAVFNDVGFELLSPGLTINGATFIMNSPNGDDCIAINVYGANNVKILNNVINYTCNYANTANYNHVITIVDSNNVEVSGNNITAYLPLKDVDYSQPYPSIYTDLVAGVAVQGSYKFRFTNNRLLVNVSRNSTGYPTLDAFIIVNSEEANITNNTIIEIDNKTLAGNNNYLYAVDVYQCSNSVIDMNNITLESQGGSFIAGTNNGTGAAYGIQLTGGHTGIKISNNNITTSNNGPNCGIYSQNYPGPTSLNITGNRINVSGNAGLHAWSLVTGMELGDDDDYVARNIVNVINKAPYVSTHNAYGISYSQSAMRHPYFNITNNTVEVKNGTYAVFIMSGGRGSVTYNCLNTTAYCCNNAVNSNPNVNVSGNYCPLGSNCTCGCNCTTHKNNIPNKSILKSGDILGVSALDVLSSVNDELLTENSERIIYVGENTEDGNGSYENPFASLQLAHASITGHYDKIIINIFNGTYHFNKELTFDTDELIVQGISGEVIINTILRYTSMSQNKEAFRLSSANSKFYANNITFDGTGTGVTARGYWAPFYGDADTATFTNCKFTSIRCLMGPKSFNSFYINCVFENWNNIYFFNDQFDGNHFVNFKNSIFSLSEDFDRFTQSNTDSLADIRLDGIWFNQNSIPGYVTSTPGDVELTKYAIFSASETYIGNNLYEIVGKLTWNGTDDVADCFNPMTVTLSSSTGDIQTSAVLVDGTFKANYTSNSSDNLVNVKLDSFDYPSLSFNSTNFVVDAPSISYGYNQNITVTFPQIVSGNITVLVDETPYVENINNNSIVIQVTGVLSVGTHNVNVTFVDGVNHIYGFNTTSFTVSKVSNYDFNATVNPTSLYIGDNATVSIVTLPSGAAGNITVRVRGKDAVVFDVNDVIVIGGFVAGENNVNITFSGDNYDAKSIEIIVFASTRPTTLSAPDVTTDYNVTKDLVITLTSNNDVLTNKTVNVVVGSINENLTTDAGGKVSIDISNLDPNTYTATITFAGDELYNSSSTTSTVVVKENIKTNITIPEITTGKATTTTIKLPEKATGNITLTVDGKIVSVVNLTNGSATITIPELTAGKHDVVISYSGDGNYAAFSQNSTVTVKEAAKPTPAPAPVKKAKQATKIVAKKKTFKAKTKVKKYTITLKTKAGKAVKKVQVTIKIGKKTFKAKTNAKGKATFKIKKLTKKAKYTATIKFKGNANYNATTKKVKITIKK